MLPSVEHIHKYVPNWELLAKANSVQHSPNETGRSII